MINFVSNLDPALRTGGFSAMNVAALECARRCGPVHYVGPVNPAARLSDHLISKARRTLGLRGSYFFFSQERLRRIADEVEDRCDPGADLDFFHGFTPWILIEPERPYLAWSDCIFHDYIRIYHPIDRFNPEDIQRIETREAAWLLRAEKVLFTSQWGAERAHSLYGIPRERVGVVGIFGEIEPPQDDPFTGSNSFLFVSTNFHAKGGQVVVSAFHKIRSRHPEVTLTVVGDTSGCPVGEGVECVGFLRKEVPEEAARFRGLLANALAVVHPTRSDILPLLLVEAGYFGVPAISSDLHAIGEFISDRVNGILLRDPDDINEVAAAMESMLTDPAYATMRRAVREQAESDFSRGRFEGRLVGELENGIQTTRP